VLKQDDETDIAKGVGKSASMVSKYLNPENERESPGFKSAAIFAEWIAANPERGKEALRRHVAFIERALPGKDTTPQGLLLAAVKKAERELEDMKMVARRLPGVEWEEPKKKK